MNKIKHAGKFLMLAALAFALAICVVGCATDDGFEVSQVALDPLAFGGEITINGTVTSFSPDDPNFFGVMDTTELLQCGQFDCGAWIMPTLYMGAARPHIEQGDNVVLTGQFVSMDGMVTFQVASMDVGNNIMNRLP